MRNSLAIWILFFIGCSAPNTERSIPVKPFPLNLKPVFDPSSKIVIYAFNPIDCENCKAIDKSLFKVLTVSKKIPQKNIVYIMPGKRPIEIPMHLRDMFGDKWEEYRDEVISNDSLWESIYRMNKLNDTFSYLMIYNAKGDSILYKSFTHDVPDSVIAKYF